MLELGKAHKLADLIEAAHKAERQFEGQVWFRGHAQHDWHLVPSAHRKNPVLESQFIHHFRLRAPSLALNCPNHKDYASWLPLMQHYGLPTRLLDWTESLLVATFFALPQDTDDTDGAIWMLAPGKLNELSIGYIIPFLADERAKPFIADAFSGNSKSENQNTIAVLAPRTDRRMAAQLGNYSIHGNREALELHPESSRFLSRIIIPVASQGKIRTDLSVSGIRRSSLFPDLANLAHEISEFKAIGPDGEDLESQNRT